jgi:hypothetical protein
MDQHDSIVFGENNLIAPTISSGTLTTGCIQTWPWDTTSAPCYPYTTIYTTPQTPYFCDGNVHVFGCDHADKCKCGKSKRTVEPPKCAHCGKEHS